MHFNNIQIDNSQDMVDLFAKYFSGMYTQLLQNTTTNLKPLNFFFFFRNSKINLPDIFQEFDILNFNLHCGLDNISLKFLYN